MVSSFGLAALALSLAQLLDWPIGPALPSRTEVAACLSQDQPVLRRIHEDAVLFCGRISPRAVELLRGTLRSTDRTLMIASFGGEVDAPLRMAELVRDRALRVMVVGPCLSGCASFVFVAGHRRTIARGGIVGLHNTSTSALYLARTTQGEIAPRDEPLRLRALREQELYRTLNVNLRLLTEPQARLETICVEVSGPDERTGETRYLIRTRYGVWVPTRAQWRAFGVYFDGAVPTSGGQAAAMLGAFGPSGTRRNVAVAYSRLSLLVAPEIHLADVDRCESPL